MTDEGFDLSTDPMHCGRCDHACPRTPERGRGVRRRHVSAHVRRGVRRLRHNAWHGCEASLSSWHVRQLHDVMLRATMKCADDLGTGLRCVSSCRRHHVVQRQLRRHDVRRGHCGTCDHACPSLPMRRRAASRPSARSAVTWASTSATACPRTAASRATPSSRTAETAACAVSCRTRSRAARPACARSSDAIPASPIATGCEHRLRGRCVLRRHALR